MTKRELINQVSRKVGLTKEEVGNTIGAITETIKNALSRGEKVTLANFGTFRTSNRTIIMKVDPQTKEIIQIPARKALKFMPGKGLKERIIGRKYTCELLFAFKRLFEEPQAGIRARAREAIGIAIINEAEMRKENLRKFTTSLWKNEVRTSFNEMIGKRWIEQIQPPQDAQAYQEFQNAIVGFYGRSAVNLKKKISKRGYPFGDHWFKLIPKGEQALATLSQQADSKKEKKR